MEDEDEKIRRNLVALSAVILISTWLEIPLSAVAAKFVDNSTHVIEAYKLWAVGFALLIYMGLRYLFSSEGTRYKSAIQSDLTRRQLDMALGLVQRQMDAFVRSGVEPAVLVGNLKQIARDRAARLQRVGNDGQHKGLSLIRITLREQRDTPWNFLISASWAWSDDTGRQRPLVVNLWR